MKRMMATKTMVLMTSFTTLSGLPKEMTGMKVDVLPFPLHIVQIKGFNILRGCTIAVPAFSAHLIHHT